MTTLQKRKILQKIVDIESDIKTLKQVRLELASTPYISATLASGGSTRSYTRADISKITEAIKALEIEYKKYHKMLNENSGASKQIYQVWF